MNRSLYIFRRDLRLEDNTALNCALRRSKEVVPAFIFDERQLKPHPYFSPNAFECMLNSLSELHESLLAQKSKLHLFFGTPQHILEEVIPELMIDGVFLNRDYTPFSLQRDSDIQAACDKHNIPLLLSDDLLLTMPEKSVKDDGKPYTVFTPFFKRNSRNAPLIPAPLTKGNIIACNSPHLKPITFIDSLKKNSNVSLFRLGGRKEAIQLLEKLPLKLKVYKDERDFPALDSTTGLSVHNKFGTCSIREIYYRAKNASVDSPFESELYWRDFFTTIGFFFPHVFKESFNPSYKNIAWSNDEKDFESWCNGETGFPIIDAGMRQLNETGFMHNRVRMIVASFLVKDLHINWQWGERYFAQKLLDYDPAVNNGSWQWAASTGCDAQPYFRIFNPWLQQKKFDDKCIYIKRWVPELKNLSPKEIHSIYDTKVNNYPAPIVDHSIQKEIALELFENAAKSSQSKSQ